MAMENALAAMLAGDSSDGGDWDPENSVEDMQAAYDWVCEQIHRKQPPAAPEILSEVQIAALCRAGAKS